MSSEYFKPVLQWTKDRNTVNPGELYNNAHEAREDWMFASFKLETALHDFNEACSNTDCPVIKAIHKFNLQAAYDANNSAHNHFIAAQIANCEDWLSHHRDGKSPVELNPTLQNMINGLDD